MKRVRTTRFQGGGTGRTSAVPSPNAPAKGAASPGRAKRCQVCLRRAGTTDVSVGPVTVKVCDPCASPVSSGLQFFGALKKLLG